MNDINDNNIYVKEELQRGILIFGEENNGFFNQKHKKDSQIINKVLQTFVYDLLPNNKIYYMASGLCFDYDDLNNVITTESDFLKTDSLISNISDYNDIKRAIDIWTESCNENRLFIVTNKDTSFEDEKEILKNANLLIIMSPDYFGYGFFVTYNKDYEVERNLTSILNEIQLKTSNERIL